MKKKWITAAAAAFLLSTAAAGGALAGPSGADGGADEAYQARLADNTLEYSELADLVEQNNAAYKNTYSQAVNQSQSLEAARQLGKDANELMEEAMDLKDDDMDDSTRALYESYKDAAQAMRKQAAELSNQELSGTVSRSLNQLKHQQTMLAQRLMIQYERALSGRELAAKKEELAKANLDIATAKAGLGMSSSEEALAANQEYLQAQSAVVSQNAAVEQAKQNLLITVGWQGAEDPQIAPVPEADPYRIDSMDVAQDTQRAQETSYTFMSLRRNGATGAVDRASRSRNVEQARQGIGVSIQSLYGKAVSARQAFEGAEAEYQAAVLDRNAADQKNAMGMMSQADYLQAQVDYLTAESERTEAKLDLLSAIETYEWALRGMILSES